jgi:hypothetical protein
MMFSKDNFECISFLPCATCPTHRNIPDVITVTIESCEAPRYATQLQTMLQ